MGIKTKIEVKFVREGVHRFPRATEPQFATGDEYDVSHLANPHSHFFHFVVVMSVTHDDREIEFLQFRRWLENQYRDGYLQLDYKSCEMMAHDLMAVIQNRYGTDRDLEIRVYEDDINGAVVQYTPD